MAKKLMLYFLKCLSSEVSIENLFRIRPSSVGNKAERRISKRVFQENKARQIFRKTSIFNSLIRTRTCVSQGVKNVCFSENLAYFVFLKYPF